MAKNHICEISFIHVFVKRCLIIKIHFYYISYNSNHSEKNLRCSPSTQKRQAIARLHKNSNLWNCGFGARKHRLHVDAKLNTDKKTFVFTRYVWTGSNGEFKMSRRQQQRELYRCSILFSTFLWRHCTTTAWNCLNSRFTENINYDAFFFLFLNIADLVLTNSTRGEFSFVLLFILY